METSAQDVQGAADTAPADTAAADAQAVEAKGSESPPDGETVKPAADPIQSRIDELTKAYRTEQRARFQERQKYESELQSLRTPVETKTEAAAKTLSDFEYDEGKYQAYLFGEAQKRSVEAARREIEQENEKSQRQQKVKSFSDKEMKFSESTKDYLEVTRSDGVPLTKDIVEIAMDCENGPEVLYFLGKNIEMAHRIAMLPLAAQNREIGRIEAKLEADKAALKAAKKTVSKAPEPAAKVAAGGDGTSFKVDEAESDTLSDQEWTRRRNAQEAAKRRRSV